MGDKEGTGQAQDRNALRQTMTRIPLARPFWNQAMEDAAIEVLRSKKWVKGEQGRMFGAEFASWCGAEAAVPCQSGSAALWAALRLLDIGPGDEVIVPGLTFIATATAVSLVGATPVFADVEPDYWCICPVDVKSKISDKTKAVIGVHLFGQPFSQKLRKLCDENNIALIEDAAQAHGATMDGKKIGSIGDIACFSFFPSKNMAVGGEGGMITTTRKDLAERMNRLINHGRDDTLESIELGTNLRMSEVQAAIGRKQLEKIDEWTQIRNNNSEFIQHNTTVRKGCTHAWHQLCILSDQPNELISSFDRQGIDARVHYPIPCNRQQVYSEYSNVELKVCESIAHRLVAIPVHPSLTTGELEKINKVLHL